jgi:hypothetical protein
MGPMIFVGRIQAYSRDKYILLGEGLNKYLFYSAVVI